MYDWTAIATVAERLRVEEEMKPFRLTDEPATRQRPTRPTCREAMITLGWHYEPCHDRWVKVVPTGLVQVQNIDVQAHYGRSADEFIQWLVAAGPLTLPKT